VALRRSLKYEICPGESNCPIYESNPCESCIDCPINFGYRKPEDEAQGFEFWEPWISHLCYLHSANAIAPVGRLKAEELHGLMIIANEIPQAQKDLHELKEQQRTKDKDEHEG
jgi:hypothetical protein